VRINRPATESRLPATAGWFATVPSKLRYSIETDTAHYQGMASGSSKTRLTETQPNLCVPPANRLLREQTARDRRLAACASGLRQDGHLWSRPTDFELHSPSKTAHASVFSKVAGSTDIKGFVMPKHPPCTGRPAPSSRPSRDPPSALKSPGRPGPSSKRHRRRTRERRPRSEA